MKTWCVSATLVILFLLSASASAAVVNVQKSEDGWRLLVDGKLFFIKGMVYEPDKVGESSHDSTKRNWAIVDDDKDGRIDSAYQSWIDANGNNQRDLGENEIGDFQLLKDMGCNVIRIYHHSSDDPDLVKLHPENTQNNNAPNKSVYRQMHETYGIWIMMGDLVGAYTIGSGATWEDGTDYRDPQQRANMLKSVEAMVQDFKDEPYILLWNLGNENDFVQFTKNNSKAYPEEYATLVNEAARLIHELDPNHPVALINGDVNFLRKYAHLIPEVDIMGYNNYGYPTFGTLWDVNARAYDKPMLLSEFGTGYPPVEDKDGIPMMNEKRQARTHRQCWEDIAAHAAGRELPGNSIGGFVFAWMDDWWQDGNPYSHDLMPDGWHHEWNGVMSQGNGAHSPLMRQAREVYYTYKKLWTEEK